MKRKRRIEHKFTWTEKYSGTCGDHYCPGHYDKIVTCTCGYTETNPRYRDDPEKLLLYHRLDSLEKDYA